MPRLSEVESDTTEAVLAETWAVSEFGLMSGLESGVTPMGIVLAWKPTGSVVAFCANEDAMVPARTIAAMERMEVGGFMVWKMSGIVEECSLGKMQA